MKPAPIPWMRCGPGGPPDSTGLSSGSTATICRAGLARFQHLADPGQRAAGSDAADHDIDRALRVPPDLLGGGLAVDLGIGRVLELLRHERVGQIADDLLGPARSRRASRWRPGSVRVRRRAEAACGAARSTCSPASSGLTGSPWRRRRRPVQSRYCPKSARPAPCRGGYGRPLRPPRSSPSRCGP